MFAPGFRIRFPEVQVQACEQAAHEEVEQTDKTAKMKAKDNADKRHKAKPMPQLEPGDTVFMRQRKMNKQSAAHEC